MRPRRTRPRLRKVYLLPNLFTAFNLFLGIYAIVQVLEKDLDSACWCIFWAIILDGLDGAVARLTRTQSAFGLQFDSLSDMVSFGIAPSAAMFTFLGGFGSVGHRLAVGVCALYSICGALRLARYNVQAHGEERRSFVGLPIPGGAGVMIFTILVLLGYVRALDNLVIPVWPGVAIEVSSIISGALPFVVLGTALLMVSEIPYPSLVQEMRLRRRMPFDLLVTMILGIGLVVALQSDLRVVLLFGFTFLYVFYGLGRFLFRRFVSRQEDGAEGHSYGEQTPQGSSPLRK